MTEEKLWNQPSVNRLAEPLVRALKDDAAALRIEVSRLANETVVVDAGIRVTGGLEAGRRIAEICLGGLGQVSLRAGTAFANWRWHLDVHTANPVLACLASQYAGWSLQQGEGKGGYQAMGSGPARAMGSREALFDELGYRDKGHCACLVIEGTDPPPAEVGDRIAMHCGIRPENLTLILTPTTTLSGAIQVVARSLEVALHKVHTLGFPLTEVRDGAGTAPLCPPSPDFITAIGRTNDAILFGGQVHLFVDSGDADAGELAQRLPSSASKDHGKPFAEIFKDHGYKFYDIDPMLFSPARVTVTSLKTGRSFHAGELNERLLEQSFA